MLTPSKRPSRSHVRQVSTFLVFPKENKAGWITGSDLCFSIRSVLLVEEPSGDKLEERGVRGERRASRVRSGWAVADSCFCCKTNGKPYISES